MPGRYALIVANGTYRDEKLKRLRTPTRDAEELARVLHDPKIGDFAVELAVDEPESVLRRKIATFFADRGRDDLLRLHFSCHGLKTTAASSTSRPRTPRSHTSTPPRYPPSSSAAR